MSLCLFVSFMIAGIILKDYELLKIGALFGIMFELFITRDIHNDETRNDTKIGEDISDDMK